MRWWLIFILVLVACSSSRVRINQTIEVEGILDDNGDVVIFKTKNQRRKTWMEMFANGKYQRFPELAAITPDSSFMKKWDGKITYINLDTVVFDFQNSFMFAQLPNDEIEDVLLYERWPWGKQERKRFSTLFFNDMTQGKLDSIRADSVAWFFDVTFIRDSLIVCGESFKTLTPRKLNQCVDIPQKVKNWFSNNIGSTKVDIPLWNILKDNRGKFKTLWLRHPAFRKYAARWIKKRSQ